MIVAILCEPAALAVEFLAWLKNILSGTPTLALIPAGSSELVLDRGSGLLNDFLIAPANAAEFRHRVRRMMATREQATDPATSRIMDDIGNHLLVGRAPAFVDTIAKLPKYAASGMRVLITGETGTGKELCARALHMLSSRKDHPFIAADCSVLPSHLFENEMFGHVRGAYTGAGQDNGGLVSAAEGGTLFLDEVDSLAPSSQGKLLRFLQEKTYRPLGSAKELRADVNVIAATNADLNEAVSSQKFRSDLYFRLNVLHLHLPPLRERLPDLALLSQHFLNQISGGVSSARSVSAGALERLASYGWPGNVRELANVIQRAAILCEHDSIQIGDLALGPQASLPSDAGTFQERRQRAVEAFERSFIERMLIEHAGNVTHAAKAAGKDRRVFGRLMKRYAIKAPASERTTAVQEDCA
jgi:two-component system response regulator GlrR